MFLIPPGDLKGENYMNQESMTVYGEENDKKQFMCSDCDKSYSRKQELKCHIESFHKGKKLYECSE